MADTQQLRARRRYRALLREAQNLRRVGQEDEKVFIELRKLEEDYPDLKETVGSLEPVEAASRQLDVDSLFSQRTTVEPATDSLLSAVVTTSVSLSEKKKADSNICPTQMCGTFSELSKQNECAHEDANERHHVSVFGCCTAFVFCAINIWTEAHLATSLSLFSYVMLTASSVLVTALHRSFVDPCSLVGKATSPLLLCCLVHFQNIYTIYLKRPERISFAMLSVYLVFDMLPSMVFVFVVCILTTIILEMLG